MKKILCLIFACSILLPSMYSQQKPAYIIFDADGKKKSYRQVLKSLNKANIILFGEIHNNPISHWLQFEIAQDLYAQRPIMIGAEMFERDNQDVLAQYMEGKINHENLDSLARLWRNYETDYKPLVDFAKEAKISFVSTNIPRRYASMVYKGGFEALDTLPEQEKAWIAPLPIKYDASLPGYKNLLTMMGGHGGENFPKAQAIKDATMAHFILHHYDPNKLFIHLNGAYHSENYEGILWYLQQENSDLNYVTITTVSQESISNLETEHKGKADFIICVPKNMTKTY